MNYTNGLCLMFVAMMLAANAQGAVFKCIDDGVVTYSDRPCAVDPVAEPKKAAAEAQLPTEDNQGVDATVASSTIKE